MFCYVLSQTFREICALRANSKAVKILQELSKTEPNSNVKGVQKLQFDLHALKAFLTANLVGVVRQVEVSPEFKGRTYDSSKPQQRELLGYSFAFYETEVDHLLLVFVDIYLELESYDANESWLYWYCGKTHREYREFLQINKM